MFGKFIKRRRVTQMKRATFVNRKKFGMKVSRVWSEKKAPPVTKMVLLALGAPNEGR